MGRAHAAFIALLGVLILAGWLLVGRALDRTRAAVAPPRPDTPSTASIGGPVAPGRDTVAPPSAETAGDRVYTEDDRRIFRETVAWARDSGVDSRPLGEIIVETGRRFVGAPYTPHTIELPGPERLVINLREFDCVTYVESMLALARAIREGGDFDDFAAELRRIRYRGGAIDGYTSRLHYFSEWIDDNAAKGVVRDVTAELGGRPDDEPIDFMTAHVDAYPSFAGHPDRVEAVRGVERALSRRTRTYLPEDRIAGVASRIRDGDVIAVTSALEGLDVAHTGLAIWLEGRLHLMHAPLVGRELEISAQPLAVRVRRIDAQDGIMVARPL